MLDASRRFAEAARAAGDQVHVVEDEGDHYPVVDPTSTVWSRVVHLVGDVHS